MSSEGSDHLYEDDMIDYQPDEVDSENDEDDDAQSEIDQCDLNGYQLLYTIVSSARRIHENSFTSNRSVNVHQPLAQHAQHLQAAGHPPALCLAANCEPDVDWDEVSAQIHDDDDDEEIKSQSDLSDCDWEIYAERLAQEDMEDCDQEQRRHFRDELVEDAYLRRMHRRRQYETWKARHLLPAKFVAEAKITASPKVQILSRELDENECMELARTLAYECNSLPISFDTSKCSGTDLPIDVLTGLHIVARFQWGHNGECEAFAFAENQGTKQGHIMQLFLTFRLSTTIMTKTLIDLFTSLNKHSFQTMPQHMVQDHPWIAQAIVRFGHLFEEQKMAGCISMERTVVRLILDQSAERPRIELVMFQAPADGVLHARYAALKNEWHSIGMALFREDWQDSNGMRRSRVKDILIFDPSPVSTLTRSVRWGGISGFAAMFLDYVAPVRRMRCPRIWYSKDICVPLNGESALEWTLNWMYWVWMQGPHPLVAEDDPRLDGFFRIYRHMVKADDAAESVNGKLRMERWVE